jgi:peptide/nickel transport system substrate-binding protein
MSKLEEVLLQDVPLIPVTEQVDWDEYNTAEIGGWPTASDPYAQPMGGYSFPDWGFAMLKLYPK